MTSILNGAYVFNGLVCTTIIYSLTERKSKHMLQQIKEYKVEVEVMVNYIKKYL